MNRGFLPQKRHRAREMALQLLYALDFRRNQSPDQALEFFAGEDDPEIVEYTKMLTFGAWGRRTEIDNLIREHVVGWRPERMVAVDRAALRLAIFESLIAKSAPVAVVISEAVELAKTFGTDESGKFVNGVLGRIVRSLPSEAPPQSECETSLPDGTSPVSECVKHPKPLDPEAKPKGSGGGAEGAGSIADDADS